MNLDMIYLDMIYLDHAATTPVKPEALQAAWPWLTSDFGNPSSSHELGHRSAVALEQARATVAKFFNVRASEVTFTSGGTESDNLAIIGLALANPRGKHIVSARTEHEAVLSALDFLERMHDFEISWLELDEFGQVLNFETALRPDTTLVSLMIANNEIGTVHDIAHLTNEAHKVGALFHTDAVQAVGWIDLDVKKLGVDALSISGHKFGAPKGSGVLILRAGAKAEPLIHGGGQESGLRSGTENVAWAVAIATALELLAPVDEEAQRVARLRDEFIQKVQQLVPSAKLTGHPINRSPNIASFTLQGVSGEAVLLELERKNVIVSSGSACAAGSDEPSHVLVAIGVETEIAQTAIRFSLAHETTADQLDAAAHALAESVANFI
ncbi:cysteine desulfurase family protein [Rhodoluna lacicola]|uniref:cysteine desulfurase n=1 Tax=Rhodoluna lacicola TaxID=529884 RepID=A0A060JH66_9MICO|nr:Cysteine sulfinate desulfinase/cysteine desulfurase-like protein [Rhodoluna lacicola]